MATPASETSIKAKMEHLPICSFPPEIIDNIAFRLPIKNICSLRLTCRDLEAKSFRVFSTHFKTVKTDLSTESLGKLEAISKHKELKKFVEVLHLSERQNGGDPGDGFIWERRVTPRAGLPLFFPHPVVNILRDILAKNLVNCRSFEIGPYSHCSYLQPGSHRRSHYLGLIDILGVLLEVIAEGDLNAQKLSFLEKCTSLDWDHLDIERYRMPQFLSAFASLRKLKFRSLFAGDVGRWMVEILEHAESLQELELNLYFRNPFTSQSFVRRLSSADTLPSLVKLHLGTLHMWQGDLLVLLGRLSHSLRVLQLFDTELSTTDSWVLLFKSLKEFPLLEDFACVLCGIVSLGPQAEVATFNTLRDNQAISSNNVQIELLEDGGHVKGVKYKGPRMSEALELIAEAVDSDSVNRV